jgi:hypothetical protein
MINPIKIELKIIIMIIIRLITLIIIIYYGSNHNQKGAY